MILRKIRNHPKLIEMLEQRTLMAAPLVITRGGTYTGTWESTNRSTPAISVNTTEPVIILNSVVRGPGDLIVSSTSHTNITVRNTKGYGVNPNVAGKTVGEFVDVYAFDNLVVENSYMEGTAGINALDYQGDHTLNETIKIVGNKALNIDGRKSNGAGGYLDFNERTSKADGHTETGYEYVQFVQFDKVYNVPGVEIAWNEVINEPGKSRPEDNISIYKSSGTASSPIRIHDNYIEGAYTVKPWQGDTSDANWTYDWSYSGGGIMLGDGMGSTGALDTGFVKAYDNTVISTTNYGMAISAGHDLEYFNNRIFSAGVLADGRPIAAQNVGAYVWDIHHGGPTRFYNNLAHDNLAGWVKANGSRNDYWTNDASTMPNNVKYSGTVTRALEAAEHAAWTLRFTQQNGSPFAAIAADGSLHVTGTDGDDRFSLSTGSGATADHIVVSLNGQSLSFAAASVSTVEFAAGAGNDTLDFSGVPAGVAAVHFNGEAGGAAINVNAGTFTFAEDAANDNPQLVVTVATGGRVVFGATQHLAELNVAGGRAVVTAGGATRIVTRSISVHDGGVLDLNDNALMLAAGDAGRIGAWDSSAYTGVTGLLASAYNYSAWDGAGIGSTAAGASAGLMTLATADGAALLGLAPGETALWDGQTVDATTVIVKYTYAGDLNLDGLVDAADYGVIDNYFQFPGTTGYANGDFNFDGIIDAADYGVIDNAFQLQGAPL